MLDGDERTVAHLLCNAVLVAEDPPPGADVPLWEDLMRQDGRLASLVERLRYEPLTETDLQSVGALVVWFNNQFGGAQGVVHQMRELRESTPYAGLIADTWPSLVARVAHLAPHCD